MTCFRPIRPRLAVVAVLCAAVLSACARPEGRDAGGDAAALPPPARPLQGLPGTTAARSAADLDRTTDAERAAALGAGAVTGRELGRVRVSLGAPAEQGFWLKSSLVGDLRQGSVTVPGGASVAVELRPGDGVAQLSLAAFRALGLGLTSLPEVIVTAH